MVQYNSLVDRIATDLRELGRTTIREALKSLVVRGLVTKQGRGVVAADPELLLLPGADLAGLAAQTSIRQLFEVRKLMEVRVAGWAAMRATAEDINTMRLAIQAEISRNTAAGNPNRTFHDALAKSVHNPALMQVYESGRTLFFRLPFFWKLFDDDEVKTVRAWRHELRAAGMNRFSKPSNNTTPPRPKARCLSTWILWKKIFSTDCSEPTAIPPITIPTLILYWPVMTRTKKCQKGNV